MDSFTYVDIFATKGIEYLLVIGFLIALIFFWRVLNKTNQPARAAFRQKDSIRVNGGFQIALGRFYHQGHSWVQPVGGDVVTIGINDFAHKFLGTPKAVTLPAIGSKIKQGKAAWKLQIGSTSVDMIAPIDGEIIDVNEKLLQSPEVLQEDPYEKGWFLKAKVTNWKSNISNLLSDKLALAWMDLTSQKLQEKLAGNLGFVLQDGGAPITGFALQTWPKEWKEIAKEFLLTS
ncbi:MAG: glycine cleavage system protein H [Calditrichaeota bacterium]|nr:glycine cleavage system protein H [Calditrichota bacterium]